jgi:DNA-binding beta-propeller fold protein YncE
MAGAKIAYADAAGAKRKFGMRDYIPVPHEFELPANMNFGSVSGVAINSKGHVFLLHRGPSPLMEFTAEGQFVRALGDGLYDRPHGLRIDAEDNIWTTDVGGHVVYKFNPAGRIQMVLGVRGRPGDWHDFGHLKLFNEPNDVAITASGDIIVLQGHGKGPSQALKFDRDGNFLKSWGKKGTASGDFDLPHSIVIDAKGHLHIADRNNARIQVFDDEGNFIRESEHPGTPCGLCLASDGFIYMAHGHTGLVKQLDLDGNVLGETGGQGKTPGRFGEAHYIAVSQRGEIYVTDTLNWRVQKYVKR